MRKTVLLVLLTIFALAYFLRVLFLKDLTITFHYDMARDAFYALQIAGGHLKILGPPTSTPGIYHGVFYYYVLAPAYLLGHGNPIFAAYWIALLNTFSVFLTFYLTYQLTKKIGASILASLLYAVSFEATQYATWLSNPTLALWTVPLIYIGLWAWIKQKKSWGSLLTGLGLGLSIQTQIFLAYHLVPVMLWLFLFRNKISRRDIFRFICILLLVLSSIIGAEVKFGFKGISGLYYLFSSQDKTVQSFELGSFLVVYFNQLGKSLAYTIFPSNEAFGGLVGITILSSALFLWAKAKRHNLLSWEPFLATYIFSHLFILPFGGSGTPHIMAGVTSAVAALVGAFTWKFMSSYRYIFIGIIFLILLSNLTKILSENVKGETTLVYYGEPILSDELRAIDYTYEKANGKKFSINTLTRPLYVNTLWSYLYNWYGKQKYGYLPSWTGRDQVGLLGNNLPDKNEGVNEHFFISESTYGIPKLYVDYARGEEDATSTLVGQEAFGVITVQERAILSK